jgi:predicted RND superfamily exporter protein
MALMNDAFMQASVRDLAILVPAMMVVMLVAMGFLLRSASGTVAVAVVLALSSSLSMAIAGWCGYPLTPSAVAAPLMVLTVAIADGVHIVLAAMDELRDGRAKHQAIVTAVSTNLEAITYTWLTTIVGFLCLNYSDAPPVRHLANMTSFGVTFAFIYSITLLPAVLTLLPMKAARATSARTWRATERLARFVQTHRIGVLAAAAAITLVAGALAGQLRTNDQFVQYFGRSIPFREDADFTLKHLSGIYRLEFQLASDGPSGIHEPAYLARLDRFAQWLRGQPEVDHVYALTDVVKRVHQAMDGNRPEAYALPATREGAAEALFLYEMSLPEGADLRDRVDVDRSNHARERDGQGHVDARDDCVQRAGEWLAAPERSRPGARDERRGDGPGRHFLRAQRPQCTEHGARRLRLARAHLALHDAGAPQRAARAAVDRAERGPDRRRLRSLAHRGR